MCSSALSLTSALYGVGDQRHAPAALHPEKTLYPLYITPWVDHRADAENLATTGIRSPDRPAVASRYTQ